MENPLQERGLMICYADVACSRQFVVFNIKKRDTVHTIVKNIIPDPLSFYNIKMSNWNL